MQGKLSTVDEAKYFAVRSIPRKGKSVFQARAHEFIFRKGEGGGRALLRDGIFCVQSGELITRGRDFIWNFKV